MAPQPPPLLLLGVLLVPCASRSLSINATAAPTVVVTLAVVLPERNLSYPWAWPRVAPALSLALEALQPQLSLAGISVRIVFASSEDEHGVCQHQIALLKVAQLKTSQDPDVLLGLGCTYTSNFEGTLALYWQLPFLRAGMYQSYWYSSTEMHAVYTGPVGPDLSAFEARLLLHFNWTSRVVQVISREKDYWDYHYHVFNFRGYLANAPYWNSRYHIYEDWEPAQAVRAIQAHGRVVFILGSLETLQEIMHQAQAQNMTNGDYVFFYLDIFGESLRALGHRKAGKPWQNRESNDTGDLQEAFQTVLVITPHEPQTRIYRHFQSQLVLRAQRDFGVTLNESWWQGHLVAGCFYDGLLLYLKALTEMLREGGSKRNSSHILEKMKGQKFQGVTGTVTINHKNVREMDYDLWAMRDVESGEFQVVGHYIGSKKRIKWMEPIQWKRGRPPLDNPPCVFNTDDPSCGKSGCVRK